MAFDLAAFVSSWVGFFWSSACKARGGSVHAGTRVHCSSLQATNSDSVVSFDLSTQGLLEKPLSQQTAKLFNFL